MKRQEAHRVMIEPECFMSTEYLELSDRTIRNRVANLTKKFYLEDGAVKRGKALQDKASKAKKKMK